MTDFHVDATVLDRPAPAMTVADVITARAKLEETKRIILCNPDCAEEIRRAVRWEGLEHLVQVRSSEFVDEGTVYVFNPQIP